MIIGLTGKAGSGKSTAAGFLVREHGFHLVKFAGPLKDMLRAMGLSGAHIEGPLKELPCPLLCGRTPRYAMQTLGTEWGRALLGDDVWVRMAIHAARMWRNVVFDDVRYVNEATAIRAEHGMVWRIDRPATLEVHSHASESEMHSIAVDGQITNNGSVEQLREAVTALLKEHTT